MTRGGSVLAILAATLFVSQTAGAHPFKRDIAQVGNEAYLAEDYAKAVSEYLKAQDLEPLSAELHFNLGAGQYRQEEYEQAMEEFVHGTRADDPMIAAQSFYNLGNARYKMSKRDFEAAAAASAGQQEGGNNLVQEYVKKLEECISDYEESLKRNPDDQDAKYNLEMIRREIKNLMRRQPPQDNQQQQPQQKQDNQEEQDQQQQQEEEGDKKEQEEQQQQNEQNEGATPTPQQMGQGEATPTPQPAQEQQEGSEQEPSQEPTQTMSISEEMARNILDNLPEQRPRQRRKQRRQVDKDW